MSARSINFEPSDTAVDTKIQGTARPIQPTEKEISRFRSIISAPLKGIAKGALNLGHLAWIFQDPGGSLKKYAEPLFQKAEEKIEENIPTKNEALEGGLERAGELFIGGALSGGAGGLLNTAGSALLGGAAGQTVSELGGGPWAQAGAEIAGASLPSLARKIIPSNTDQERILELGRKYKLTEEQLAPLMPETKKRRFFGRYAFAGEGTGETLKESRQGIGGIYTALENSPSAQQVLSPQATSSFVQDINKLTIRMPHNIRTQIANDAADLVKAAQQKGGIDGQQLMNFYHDISSRYNLGRQQLELLKGPIQDALHSIDPVMAKDFATVNRMYQKLSQIGRVLKPSEYEHLISLGEAYELGASVGTLDSGRLTRLLGAVGFRKFSEKMLTSPRLQNIIEKTQNALIKNDINMIGKLGSLLQKELEEDDQE